MLTLVKNYYIANRTVFGWTMVPVMITAGMIFLIDHSVVTPVVIFTLLHISTVLVTDEKNKTDILYCSLPVKRSKIVYSRYLAALLTCAYVILLAFLVCTFIESLHLPGRTVSFPVIKFNDLFIIIIPIAVLTAGIFPFYFKYGHMKGLLLGTAASTLLSVAIAGILYFITSISGKTAILDAVMAKTDRSWIVRFISGVLSQTAVLMGKQNFLVFLSIVTIILVIVSVKVSLKFYNKRDF
jgi:ABC-type transport system involved in multi-copper enzyme maturation permease subunit